MTESAQASPRSLITLLKSQSRIGVVLIAAVLAQLALIAAFTGAMSRPTLHDAKIGLVTASPTASSALAVTSQPAKGISYRIFGNTDAATKAVRDGDLPAALIVADKQQTLVVAGSAGPALVAAIGQAVGVQAKVAGVPMTIQDVRPLPSNDPKALGTFLLVIGWVIGGYLGMMLLTRALGAATRSPRGTGVLLGWTAGYSVLSAVMGVVLVNPVLNAVTGHVWQLIAAGTLVVFAVATFTAALLSVLGLPGLILAIGSLVILGNPTSGGSVPDQMLSGGWHFLAQILPTNAGVALIRALAYFDGHQLGKPLLVLAIYAVVSVLILVGAALRRQAAAKPVPVAASTGHHSATAVAALG